MRVSNRRSVLRASGSLLFGAVGVSNVGGATTGQDITDENEFEPDFEFENMGQSVTNEVELAAGPAIGKLEYGGGGLITVHAIPQGDQGYEEILVMTDNASPGVGGMIAVEESYVFEIDPTSIDFDPNDIEWQLTITQPEATEDEAREPPIGFEGSESTVLGPFIFQGTETATATHNGDGSLEIEILPQNEDFTSSLFYESGTFDGETAVRTEGVGWVPVQAAGDWTLQFE